MSETVQPNGRCRIIRGVTAFIVSVERLCKCNAPGAALPIIYISYNSPYNARLAVALNQLYARQDYLIQFENCGRPRGRRPAPPHICTCTHTHAHAHTHAHTCTFVRACVSSQLATAADTGVPVHVACACAAAAASRPTRRSRPVRESRPVVMS